MTQRLAYNVSGQTLRHHAGARQASVDWVLEDLRYEVGDSSRTLDSGTANVDAATEVTLAIAGPTTANARLIDVASTTDFAISSERARVYYEIVNADNSEREPIELSGIDTNDALLAKHPLSGTYPIGSTVRGLTHVTSGIADAVLLDAERLAGDWPMRIVWIYADGTRHQEQVRLVLDPESDLFVTPIVAEIRDAFPDIDTRDLHHGRDVLTPHVRAQLRQFRADALGQGLRLENWVTGDQGHWCVVYRTLLHLAMLGNYPANIEPREYVAYLQRECDKRWAALTKGWGRAEILEQDQATGIAASADGTSYRPQHNWDL